MAADQGVHAGREMPIMDRAAVQPRTAPPGPQGSEVRLNGEPIRIRPVVEVAAAGLLLVSFLLPWVTWGRPSESLIASISRGSAFLNGALALGFLIGGATGSVIVTAYRVRDRFAGTPSELLAAVFFGAGMAGFATLFVSWARFGHMFTAGGFEPGIGLMIGFIACGAGFVVAMADIASPLGELILGRTAATHDQPVLQPSAVLRASPVAAPIATSYRPVTPLPSQAPVAAPVEVAPEPAPAPVGAQPEVAPPVDWIGQVPAAPVAAAAPAPAIAPAEQTAAVRLPEHAPHSRAHRVLQPSAVMVEPAPVPAPFATGRFTYVEGGRPMSIAVRIGEQVIVGRDVKADVRLADARVSRKHVALTWEGNGWTIRDLGATNPTLLLDPSGSSKELLGVSSVPSGQLLVGDVLVTLFPAT